MFSLHVSAEHKGHSRFSKDAATEPSLRLPFEPKPIGRFDYVKLWPSFLHVRRARTAADLTGIKNQNSQKWKRCFPPSSSFSVSRPHTAPIGQRSAKQVKDNKCLVYILFYPCSCLSVTETSVCSVFPTATFLLTFAEAAAAAAPIVVKAEVGGNVSIDCPSTANKTIQFFYFQKEDVLRDLKFVNGFFKGRVIENPYPNTMLDPEKQTTVHMFNLRVDHNGRYTCRTDYIDQTVEERFVDIEVTGKRETPFKP